MTEIDRLLSIMARLRDPVSGCEWDREQTYGTIAPYTIEEAYEVADAIARNDLSSLRDELGDLLLQVVFHSRIAQEDGAFEFEDVARSVSDKLEARHPHIFGSEQSSERSQTARWESLKEAERKAKGATSAMDGVALALPALMRAEKLQKRAARVGFDWPDPRGPADKVREECEELAAADGEDSRFEEAGDVLFAAVNLVRSYGIDPENALRAANAKFERRFRSMENLADDGLDGFAALSLGEQEELWQRVKQSEGGKAA
ncbi:nucleoside triphosphate pyrophosphohydrolase [Novosphingobium marinum]|uniref:ATP diphosphatase n=1 Tax=Novosphingobium marinum TaxID=1514948 RepID=A0A7Y9XVR5_9SPHN|nr:nucleoside triphosphate pyrophosphohydrolase [Novosphingobium marinum]NYH94260.1 ATP diphosphatase [Novosphingobium marinum]GGC20945.1 nucleoside triphosphate pyrophosphohydrolase [Novosphingobium marinum]